MIVIPVLIMTANYVAAVGFLGYAIYNAVK